MKLRMAVFALLFGIVGSMALNDAVAKESILGEWKFVHENHTGTLKIYKKEGKYHGKFVNMLDPYGYQIHDVLGMDLFTSLKPDGATKWTGGRLVDPRDHNVYDVSLELSGEKLTLKTYSGTDVKEKLVLERVAKK